MQTLNHHKRMIPPEVKQIILDTIFDRWNGWNIGAGIATIYAQLLILIGISATSTAIAWWVQFALGVAVGLSLLGLNLVKIYLAIKKSKEGEDSE